MSLTRCLAVLAALSSLWGAPTVCAQDEVRSAAVVVGANAAGPGRRRLRYAHNDARNVAEVLREVADFAPRDVHLMLDPEPAEVLARLDSVIVDLAGSQEPSMLLFYYSGHADAQALFPAGQPLALHDLQRRLEDTGVSVRLGILDACRGGGWTGSRGLSETEAFEVRVPMELTSEGSVLIASSSGLEDAHESEALQGGFFTHHWNAALRGAADRNGDHAVTLVEALEYAKYLTIRDTALRTETPQHPSFQIHLRGRHDLTLSRLAEAPTSLSLEQTRGPLQLVALDRGLVVLETPPGERTLRLALPPGRYLVRAGKPGSMRALAVDVPPGAAGRVRESDLKATTDDALASRGGHLPPVLLTTMRDTDVEFRFALGVRHTATAPGVSLDGSSDVAGIFQWSYGITDRWQWSIPGALAYRFGEREAFEAVLWGGLQSLGLGGSSLEGFILAGAPALGSDLRFWLGPSQSLILGLSLDSSFRWHSKDLPSPLPDDGREAPTTWRRGLPSATRTPWPTSSP